MANSTATFLMTLCNLQGISSTSSLTIIYRFKQGLTQFSSPVHM